MATIRKDRIIIDLETEGGPVMVSFKEIDIKITYTSAARLAQGHSLEEAEVIEHFDQTDEAVAAARKHIASGDVMLDVVELTVARRVQNFQGETVNKSEAFYDVTAAKITEWSQNYRRSNTPNLMSQIKHSELISV